MHPNIRVPTCACEVVATAALRGCRVLVAEDCPATQRIIARVLGKAGIDATIVGNGEAAIAAALYAVQTGCAFDFIVMDAQMPILNGVQATRSLRQAGYRGAIAAITAQVMSYDRDTCLAAGFDAYFAKPIDLPPFFDAIRRHSARFGAGTAASMAEAPGVATR